MWRTLLFGCRRSGHLGARGDAHHGAGSYRPRLDLMEIRVPLGDTLGGLLAWWWCQSVLPWSSQDFVLAAAAGPDVPATCRTAGAETSAPATRGAAWDSPGASAFAGWESRSLPPVGGAEWADHWLGDAGENWTAPGTGRADVGGRATRQPLWRKAGEPSGLDPSALAALAQLATAAPFGGGSVARTGGQAPAPVVRAGALPNDPLLIVASLAGPQAVPEAAPASRSTAAPDKKQILEAYGRVPLSFEANLGQADPAVRFLARNGGYGLFLTSTEVVMMLPQPAAGRTGDVSPLVPDAAPDGMLDQGPDAHRAPQETSFAVVRMQLVGGNPAPSVEGREQLPTKVNYFIGNDSSKWRSHVPTFAKVEYDDVYPGIDLVWYGNQQQLEYDFVVSPGADPNVIGMRFEGADRLEIDAQGDLVLHTPAGAVRQHRPFVYQEIAGVRQEIASGYVPTGPQQVGFWLGAYDAARPLVLDPMLLYSSYLGGSGGDSGRGIAADMYGNVYVTGSTTAPFPVGFPYPLPPPGFEFAGGYSDVFVTKIDASGTFVHLVTYVGGSDTDSGEGIAVEPDGWYIYVTGSTYSANFASWNAQYLQDFNGDGVSDYSGNGDAFTVMLDWDGSASCTPFSYSTYLGGSGMETGEDIALQFTQGTGEPPFECPVKTELHFPPDPIMVGTTRSTYLPPVTPGAFQPTYGGSGDAFLVRIGPWVYGPAGPSFPTWVYGSYLGGSGGDTGLGIATDDVGYGYAYVTGGTTGGFPTTPGAYDTTYNGGGADAFVTKVNPFGTAPLVYSTYLGGGGRDVGAAIAVGWGSPPYAYVTGVTDGGFPTTPGAYDTTYNGGGADVFITKVNVPGSGLIYSTYLGGAGGEVGYAIAVDANQSAHVTGPTHQSNNFPTVNAVQPFSGGNQDAFVTKLNSTGSNLVYSTYLGGRSHEAGQGIAVDPASNAYMTGWTDGGFPLFEPFDPVAGGSSEGWVAMIWP